MISEKNSWEDVSRLSVRLDVRDVTPGLWHFRVRGEVSAGNFCVRCISNGKSFCNIIKRAFRGNKPGVRKLVRTKVGQLLAPP